MGSDDDEDNVRSDHDEDYAGEDAPQGFIYPSGRYREDSDDEDLHEGGGGSSPPRARVVMRQVAAPADAQSKAALGNKSKLPPNSERRGPIAGMICLCSTRTHADVIRRGLCGLPRNFLAIVDRITPGTAVFLYNFQTKELHGVYEAQGESGENLDPSAFGGSAKGGSPFSAQFRIRTAKRTLAIQARTLPTIECRLPQSLISSSYPLSVPWCHPSVSLPHPSLCPFYRSLTLQNSANAYIRHDLSSYSAPPSSLPPFVL